MNFRIIGIILFLSINCGGLRLQELAYAEKGFLDLGRHSLDRTSLKLSGDWEFYWNRLISPETSEAVRDQSLTGYLSPGIPWSGTTVRDSLLTNKGVATYRLSVFFPKGELDKIYSLRFKTTGGAAYRIFIDGSLEKEIGRVGSTQSKTIPSRMGAKVDFQVKNQNTVFLIHIASFYHHEGSFWYPPELGQSEVISDIQKVNITIDSLLIGSILLMALYHLVIYYHRRETQSLYFSLFSLTVGLYQMSIGELILFNIIESIPYIIAHRILILFFLSAGFYISFLKSVFPDDIPSIFVKCVWFVSLGMFGFSFFTPVEIGSMMERYATVFSVIILFLGLIFLIKTVIVNRQDSKIMFLSNLVIWLGAINDGLVIFSYFNGFTVLSYAIFLSIVIQSIFLARRFSRAFSEVESLSVKLRDLNMELEDRIDERTTAYRIEKEKAEKANLWKGKFIELVSHNIRSPLYGIYSSLELISDDSLDDEEERRDLLKLTRSSILNITSAVENLLHSSRFLDDSIHIRKSRFSPFSAIQGLISQVNISAKAKHIKIENLMDEDFYIHADSDISIEVFRNLIVNAVKFTPAKGKIRIQSEETSEFKMISFTDTGIGIPADRIPYLFTSTDSSTGTAGEKGFGIGLIRSQELMKLQGGMIEVISTLNQGSKFTVYFSTRIEDR